jgi:hypothetical protein
MPDGDAPLSYQIALVGVDQFTPEGPRNPGEVVTIGWLDALFPEQGSPPPRTDGARLGEALFPSAEEYVS